MSHWSLCIAFLLPVVAQGVFDYRDAVTKSLLYFEAQRSGHLPYNQRVTWRSHSGLTDGLEQGVCCHVHHYRLFFFSLSSIAKIPSHSNIGTILQVLQVDLVGGYYDAGDHVKFGLPMAFTITMLSWSAIEYGDEITDLGEFGHTLEAIKWGTDYFVKAHTHPYVLWAQVLLLLIVTAIYAGIVV